MKKITVAMTILAVWLSAGPVWSTTAYSAESEAVPFAIDDMLHMEGIGRAEIDPSGHWLVYEKIRPYDELTDYSFRTYAMRWSGHQLWRYDLRKGQAPELLPGLDSGPSTYL